MLPAAHQKIPQLVEENRQLRRKSRKSAADEAGQKGGRLLLHLGPGVRQGIEGDEVYFLPPALGTLPSRPADSSRLRTS